MKWATNRLSMFFPVAMFAEVRAEAKRLDRSVSWVIQRAWTIYRSRAQ
jgi:uncharacterized small protein (TIGR04563 family)